MIYQFLRFQSFRRVASLAWLLAVIAGIALVGFGTAMAVGWFLPSPHAVAMGEDPAPPWLAAVHRFVGIAYVAGGAGFLAWAALMSCLLELAGKTESHGFRAYDALLDIKVATDEQSRHLRSIAENIQLSDAARSIAHRDREQDVLRSAINDDILRENWEAAYYLVDQLETRYGYKLEAQQLREEIDTSRTTLVERKIQESVRQVQNLVASRDWDKARRMVEKLLKHHPDHPSLKGLPAELESRWDEHKRRLLKEWDQAVQRDDVDTGIRVLRELDQYLTPSEAEAIKEAARDVFKAKLHNLGVQFQLAVSERQWIRALEVGDQIVREFPNTRMASEVRGKRDTLVQRADEQRKAAAAVT
ncbi:MAG: hypothetical protein L6R00_12665 [Phycisphaerae bacterium]|nr:hypothetical protein [Phycisphaerae bacterium]